jgi:hypothetical protein
MRVEKMTHICDYEEYDLLSCKVMQLEKKITYWHFGGTPTSARLHSITTHNNTFYILPPLIHSSTG